MPDIKICNVDPVVITFLDDRVDQKKYSSRNELINEILTLYTTSTAIIPARKTNSTMYLPISLFSSLGRRLLRGFFIIISPLPIQLRRGNLFLIHVIFPYHSVMKLYNSVCHIFDCVIMCYHDYGATILLINFNYKL